LGRGGRLSKLKGNNISDGDVLASAKPWLRMVIVYSTSSPGLDGAITSDARDGLCRGEQVGFAADDDQRGVVEGGVWRGRR
jgi:hypothetical protein